jgi:hypothetical protein
MLARSTRRMKPLTRIADTVRRRGLVGAVLSGGRHLRNCYLEWEIRNYYDRATESNRRFDRKYGVETSQVIPTELLGAPDATLPYATRCESIAEKLFRQEISQVRTEFTQFTFIDYGSGTGKSLLLACMYRFHQIIGIEFSEKACHICENNLRMFSSASRITAYVEVVCADAVSYVPPAVPSVFFFYNPFRGELMGKVVAAIENSLRSDPRPAWIVYCNPDCAHYIDSGSMFDLVASGRRFRVYKARESSRVPRQHVPNWNKCCLG